MITAKEDTLKKRYFYKLLTNFFGMLMSFLTAGIVPRALGPQQYGDFSYLTNFFTKITGFLDMGSSTGFYAKLSKRQKDYGLISFYLYFVGAAILVVGIFAIAISVTPLHKILLPDQRVMFICFAAGWAVLTWATQILNNITDAYALTVTAEITKVLQKAVYTVFVIVLFATGLLSLVSFFCLQFAMLFLLLLVFALVITRNTDSVLRTWSLKRSEVASYFKEFYNYSHPLFVCSLVALIAGLLDRWLLQVFGGSAQQGFYGLSFTIGSFCFMFTSAMQPLLMREFSIAHGTKDLDKMARLFRNNIPLFYSIAAYFSCFIVMQADKVSHIFGGKSFGAAAIPVAIMAFYPIHQTYGQLSSSVFFASDQTPLYRNIDIFVSIAGLIMTFFLVASPRFGGLGAGAIGLAIKMVAIQFITVNIILFFNSKYLKLSFWKYLAHQFVSVGVLLFISALSSYFIEFLFMNYHNNALEFFVAGIVYSILTIMTVRFIPAVFGLNRDSLDSMLRPMLLSLRAKS